MWPGGFVERDLPSSGALTVGRSSDCDVHVLHPSLSRHHARIERGLVEDLGSVNGTFVGERRVNPFARTLVPPGVSLRVGEVALFFRGEQDDATTSRESAARSLLVIESAAMRRVLALVEQLALMDVPVLVLGEAGVGTSTLAQEVHRRSARRDAPLVCDALDRRDDIGGLVGRRGEPGLLEQAHGGTLLLERVDMLTPTAQARLGDVLARREVVRANGGVARGIDVRLVATARADLVDRVKLGSFRADLYYRLAAASVVVPPLRERAADLVPLCQRFADEASSGASGPVIAADARRALERHVWTRNLYELRELAQVAVAKGIEVLDETCATSLLRPYEPRVQERSSLAAELATEERIRIVRALAECGGNQSKAARLLGISRRTLVTRLTEYNLPRPLKDRRI